MSVLRREIDAYQRALDAYRRRFGSAVRKQNTALQNLQGGQRYLVPTENDGQYLIANYVDEAGNFRFDTEKKGGFLGIGRKEVPRVVGADAGYPVLPEGPTPGAVGATPVSPNASMAQVRAMNRPSLAEIEGGLIEVARSDGVKQGGAWFPPKSVAQQMAKRAEEIKEAERLQREELERQWAENPPVIEQGGGA